jgi:hypothetical protein
VELQAYNAVTDEPLGGVSVVRWDHAFGEGTFQGPSGATGNDGLIGSAINEYAPSFIFSKDGYTPAEVRVEGDSAYVASPSGGNRRYRGGNSDPRSTPHPPILYERDVPARPLIRVPLWPIVQNPSPATARRGSEDRPPEPFLDP